MKSLVGVWLWRSFMSRLAFSRFSWDVLLAARGCRAYEVLHFFTGAMREATVTRDEGDDEDVDGDIEAEVEVSVKCGLSTYSLGFAR